jgi:hypothetical protein
MDCARCGGLKLAERFCGASLTAGAWSYDGYRCINCGAIFFLETNTDHREVVVCGNDNYSDTSR